MGIRENVGSFGVRKAIAVLAVLASFTGLGFSQLVVSVPSSRDNVKACADYADQVLGDRWDMTERTDLGWRIFNTAEQPQSFLRNISFAGGIFSGVSDPLPGEPTLSDPNISILDSAYKYSALNGKNGTNFPIDADKYTIFAMRMSTDVATPGWLGQLFWSKETIYDGVTTAGEIRVLDGWNYVIVRIPSLTIRAGSDPWAGIIKSLRFDPFVEPNKTIQIDWIRLAENDAEAYRTITWSGASGYMDIYLDNDRNAANGNLGTLARSASGGSYTFLAGALMPGDYYVALAPAGTTSYTYADGYYHVNDAPILNFTKPTAKGNTDDFATTVLGDAWDMANAADVEYTDRVLSPTFTNITYEDLRGVSHANQTVYRASAMPATPPDVGDPIVVFLRSSGRGAVNQIDTSKYHNLTFKMGITGAQSVVDGSIARVQWRVHGETKDNESQDIIINHKAGGWVMTEVTQDMRTLLQESGSHLSNTGWTGTVDSFRIDPHEFCDGRQFFFDDVKLTADWTANGSFPIEWTLADTDGSSTVSLYYDTNASGYDGTLITTLSGVPAGAGSYTWNTTSVANGTYWIHARIDDGTNVSLRYAGGPVIVRNAGAVPTIQLSRNRLYMGAARAGTATSQENILLTNSGQGTLSWQAASTASWLTVTPASGTGNAALKIGISVGALTVGTYQGQIRVTDPAATNSPQAIDVTLSVYAASGGDAPPFGSFDTPTSGSTVSGSVPVCGWALDDIEVSRVEIRRATVTGDPPGAIGPDGLIFVGNATFVKGARPDVEAANATTPRADRAGWGYMLLTYGLPESGMSGTFQIHAVAFDATGHRVDLGTKTITSDNAHRIKPFGTIDTPDQGGAASGGAYVNFGWVLTPLPKTIPTDGSTIQVYVDSVPLGIPVYNNFRKDIADAYPGYNNSSGAVGFYYIDTTQYANGTHTIGWSATDDAGEADGMGSRFFEILNLGSQGINSLGGTGGSEVVGGVQSAAKAAAKRVVPYIFDASLSRLIVDRSGMLTAGAKGPRQIGIEELQPVTIRITGRGGQEFVGWGRDMSRSLPIGSTLDRKTGTFTWMPGPGFLRKHVLHFAVTKGRFISPPVTVVINIKPKY